MTRRAFERCKSQHGAAVVEFAITLPLLLLLLLGIAEFGRMIYQYNSLLQASRDAVRYVAGKAWDSSLGMVKVDSLLELEAKSLAVYGRPGCGGGVAKDKAVADKAGCGNGEMAGGRCESGDEIVPCLTVGNVRVYPLGSDAVQSDHVRVSISYEFKPLLGGGIPALLGKAIPMNLTLVATTVMRGL